MMYQFELQKRLSKWGHSFAIFSLAYTLAPETIYPGQLCQAALSLQYLLEVYNRKPSSVSTLRFPCLFTPEPPPHYSQDYTRGRFCRWKSCICSPPSSRPPSSIRLSSSYPPSVSTPSSSPYLALDSIHHFITIFQNEL